MTNTPGRATRAAGANSLSAPWLRQRPPPRSSPLETPPPRRIAGAFPQYDLDSFAGPSAPASPQAARISPVLTETGPPLPPLANHPTKPILRECVSND